jgi:protocatechuate 3,4-dioxygenase beta subunit
MMPKVSFIIGIVKERTMLPKIIRQHIRCGLIGMTFFVFVAAGNSAEYQCAPTPEDALGPFYKPGAPVRNSVGKGYTLQGIVKSAADCAPIADARIEFWLAAPNRRYDDRHRATLYPDASGNYHFESHMPPDYGFRPPHIHIRVEANGFETLITQHYPAEGSRNDRFNLVLKPGR